MKVKRVDRSVIFKHLILMSLRSLIRDPFFFGEPSLISSRTIPPVHGIIGIDGLVG